MARIFEGDTEGLEDLDAGWVGAYAGLNAGRGVSSGLLSGGWVEAFRALGWRIVRVVVDIAAGVGGWLHV